MPTQSAHGRIAYESTSPYELSDIVRRSEAPRQAMFGHLLFPDVFEPPVPCIVALHGSFNWRGHHYDHILRFLEMGCAVFRIHSFDARGIATIATTQLEVTHAMLIADAYEALRLLVQHPQLDPARMGITGWSLGGTAALYAAWAPIAEALAPGGERFAAHLPIYPAAYIHVEDDRWTGAPIRSLIGNLDDFTPAAPAVALAARLAARGLPVETIEYPESHHSFDSIDEVEAYPQAIGLSADASVTVLRDGRMVVTGTEIEVSTADARRAAFTRMAHLGTHAGGNRRARRRAFADAESFLRRHLLA